MFLNKVLNLIKLGIKDKGHDTHDVSHIVQEVTFIKHIMVAFKKNGNSLIKSNANFRISFTFLRVSFSKKKIMSFIKNQASVK